MIGFGTSLALVGALMAALMAGIGSARAVGMVGEAAAGVVSRTRANFSKVLILQLLARHAGAVRPIDCGAGAEPDRLWRVLPLLTMAQGLWLFGGVLPVAVVGLFFRRGSRARGGGRGCWWRKSRTKTVGPSPWRPLGGDVRDFFGGSSRFSALTSLA